jgi:pyruvate,orthophosphate dikinase
LRRLEDAFTDVQDVEFTIENGKLWLLQTRAAKRTPHAALRLAIDFVKEGRITLADGLSRLDGIDLCALVNKRLVIRAAPIGYGTCASSGIAVGRAAFDSNTASSFAAAAQPAILVRPDTTTADVAGFASAAGVVTAIGGRTAHAALVARQMGKPCIVGCTALSVEPAGRVARLGATTISEGDWLSIDGDAGAIYLGRGDVVSERPDAELAEVERWRAVAA